MSLTISQIRDIEGPATLVGAPEGILTGLSFFMPWQVLLIVLLIVLLASLLSSLLSIRKVLVVDPAIVFRG
jgi:putative ABC transport system permease protein